MKKLNVEKLSSGSFSLFGTFVDLKGKAETIGAPPIEFLRDMVQHDLGGNAIVSYSICRVGPRPFVIDTTEYHSKTAEMMLGLDGDMLIHVGPATPPCDSPPIEKFRVFKIPAMTLVVIRPGVWHHAPFALGKKELNVLIGLPERAYANDCVCLPLDKKQILKIRK